MKILIACEFSGIVRNSFINKGHDAWSCDLINTEILGPHIIGNVLNYLDYNWDLMIAHPPCTYLCNSGVRWLFGGKGTKIDIERRRLMQNGALFFKKLINAPIDKIVIENPIMHKYAKEIIGKEHSQIIQPWQFGHGEVKATCLWVKGLSLLQETHIVSERDPKVHFATPGPDRWKKRSRTYIGIAKAMANQWG